MSDKLFIRVITLLFLLPFLVAPLLFSLHKADIIHLDDIGAKKKPDKVYDTDSAGGALLNGIEEMKVEVANIYTNYLPMYGAMVRGYNSTQLALDKSFNSFLSLFAKDNDKQPATDVTGGTDTDGATVEAPYEPVYKTTLLGSDNLYRLYLCEAELKNGTVESFLETSILKSHKELSETMNEQVEQINRIAGMNDSVNFYLYIESRFQDTDLFEKIYKNETSTRVLRDVFISKLDKKIKTSYMILDTIEDRLKHVYKTDHHWTADGIYDGYVQIINMMRENSTEILEPRERGELYTFEGNVWYGSRSRRSLYYGINDTLSVYDHKLPYHEMTDVDRVKSFDKMLKIYNEGKYNKKRGVDHYEEFFPRPRSIKYPDNKTGRNLLIIGDSYSWSGSELIASSFDNTYVFYPWFNERLDYNKFIDENGITDVIIMQFSDRIMFNIYEDCPLGNIR